jgi:hypothetical protein
MCLCKMLRKKQIKILKKLFAECIKKALGKVT